MRIERGASIGPDRVERERRAARKIVVAHTLAAGERDGIGFAAQCRQHGAAGVDDTLALGTGRRRGAGNAEVDERGEVDPARELIAVVVRRRRQPAGERSRQHRAAGPR